MLSVLEAAVLGGVAGVGLAAVIVTPREGPVAQVRQRVQELAARVGRVPRLGWVDRLAGANGAMSCLLCTSVWTGAAVGLALLAAGEASLTGAATAPMVAAAVVWWRGGPATCPRCDKARDIKRGQLGRGPEGAERPRPFARGAAGVQTGCQVHSGAGAAVGGTTAP